MKARSAVASSDVARHLRRSRACRHTPASGRFARPPSPGAADAYTSPTDHMSRAPARILALRAVFRTVGAVAPEVAARWAETIFCTPPRHEPRTGDEAFLATGKVFRLRGAGQELAAWEWGQGPAVILVHGWGSRAGRFSAMGQALVDGGFRVIAYDGPAHG